MGTIEWNRRMWDEPANWWGSDGDAWTFHAEHTGQRYAAWKDSVVETFLRPYLGDRHRVVEVGPGHGRWSGHIAGRVALGVLVDVSPNCARACKALFARTGGIAVVLNDGRTFPITSRSIDLVWSFGTFVHMDPPEVDAYLGECARVLVPGGRFVLHHAGMRELGLRLAPFTRRLGRAGGYAERKLTVGRWRDTGARGEMSPRRFVRMAESHGLAVDRQHRSWGQDRRYGLAYNDVISVGSSRGLAPAPGWNVFQADC